MATTTLSLSPALVPSKRGAKTTTKSKIGGQSPKTAAKPSYTSATMTVEQFDRLTVVQQIRHAFKPGARLAAWIGLLLGGSIPAFTFVVAHSIAPVNPWLWLLAAGGLLYSAPTVQQWATAAFGHWAKALGFVVLLEGVMTAVHSLWVSLPALAILIFINAVSAACQLQVRKQRPTGSEVY